MTLCEGDVPRCVRGATALLLPLLLLACANRESPGKPDAEHTSSEAASTQSEMPDAAARPRPRSKIPPRDYSRGTHVVILGSGTPNPDPRRSGPAVAVVSDGHAYVFDAGPGVVRRAQSAGLGGIAALRVPRLDRLFLTHLHSDHTVGLPDFIFTPWVVGRRQKLQIFGPKGTRAMTEHLLEAYRADRTVRVEGHEKLEPIAVTAVDAAPGEVYRDERVTISAFEVPHGSWEQAFGYRVVARDRTVVISGDTGPFPGIADICSGCDVLVHEVYSDAWFARLPPEPQRYHGSFHTSSTQLGAIATKAKPKLLVLYHQIGAGKEQFLAEIAPHFSGEVAFANDLDVY